MYSESPYGSSDCSIRLLNGSCCVGFYDGVPSGYQTGKNNLREKDSYLRKERAHEYQVIVLQDSNYGGNRVEMFACSWAHTNMRCDCPIKLLQLQWAVMNSRYHWNTVWLWSLGNGDCARTPAAPIWVLLTTGLKSGGISKYHLVKWLSLNILPNFKFYPIRRPSSTISIPTTTTTPRVLIDDWWFNLWLVN